MDTLEGKLSALRSSYVDTLEEKFETLSELRDKAPDKLTPDDIEWVQNFVHNLAGSGATYGYDSVSEKVEKYEGIFPREPSNSDDLAGLHEQICELAEDIREEIEDIE